MANEKTNLAGVVERNVVGLASSWIGWIVMLAVLVYTASHAINLVGHNAQFEGSALAPILYFGVAVVELLALVTAVQILTHQLRAKQKPMAILLEITWVVFAGVNLIASFGVVHGEALPPIIGYWVTYGLPVSALVVGVEFYIIMRLDPEAARIDDKRELNEMVTQLEHDAELDVMASDQMMVVIRQMKWLTMPERVGQMLGLNRQQIDYVKRFAPELFDGNGNGVPDLLESGPREDTAVPFRATTEPKPRYVARPGAGRGSNGREPRK